MSNLHARVREILKLGPDVVLTEDEIDKAIEKAPKAEQGELRVAQVRERPEVKKRPSRRFGGLA